MEDLHVEISAYATPAEAHARIAYALAEVRRFLVPVRKITFKKQLNSKYLKNFKFSSKPSSIEPGKSIRAPKVIHSLPTSFF